jgi:hypothetical protein
VGKFKVEIRGQRRGIKNKAELEFIELMGKEGWELSKRGMPDFACYKGRKLILVEVKKLRSVHLKREQYRLMQALAKRGITCYRWSPDIGFSQVLSNKEIKDL